MAESTDAYPLLPSDAGLVENTQRDTTSGWSSRPRFALDADVTVYWPDVRPCWEAQQ